ncbi:hypothetical protein Acr_00g0051810 [Actinidia rufa]|uniref:Uncharacterized protein n=1 Tax=Actinidia rufa TaxID=165716 RepID=A0A7J0DKW2_9ERIC|nr:hypothetical protein Acr_00g0051810 [Actinidia rufa]
MSSYINGQTLWRVITGELINLTKEDKELQSKYEDRVDEWVGKNHKIITWMSNTTVDQLALSEPEWSCITDIEKFTTYRDGQRLIPFLMALRDDFDPVCASLLHRSPLPTLEDAVSKLLSEKTCLGSLKTHQLNNVLATPQGRHSTLNSCSYCHSTDHVLLGCPVRTCKWCRKTGPSHFQHECFKNPNR